MTDCAGRWDITRRHTLDALQARLSPAGAGASRLFRRLFLTALADAHAAGLLAFCGEIEDLRRRKAFDAHLGPLKRKKWFVYAKPPFAG